MSLRMFIPLLTDSKFTPHPTTQQDARVALDLQYAGIGRIRFAGLNAVGQGNADG
jgi:hypothetical protein